VLRVKAGEKLLLLDGAGKSREVEVAEVERHVIRVTPRGRVLSLPRTKPDITLFQCVAKAARMEWAVEKAGELGVATFVPVVSTNCVVKSPGAETQARWQRIADSALEQCNGVWRTEVAPVCSWGEAMERVRGVQPTFVGALGELGIRNEELGIRRKTLPMRDCLSTIPPEKAGLFVGPEGDFTTEEMEALMGADVIPVSLGERILRTETAAIFGIVMMNGMWK